VLSSYQYYYLQEIRMVVYNADKLQILKKMLNVQEISIQHIQHFFFINFLIHLVNLTLISLLYIHSCFAHQFIMSFSPFLPSIALSLFHSRFKIHLFHKFFTPERLPVSINCPTFIQTFLCSQVFVFNSFLLIFCLSSGMTD